MSKKLSKESLLLLEEKVAGFNMAAGKFISKYPAFSIGVMGATIGTGLGTLEAKANISFDLALKGKKSKFFGNTEKSKLKRKSYVKRHALMVGASWGLSGVYIGNFAKKSPSGSRNTYARTPRTDSFKVMGIDKTTIKTKAELKKVHRTMIFKYHPDKGGSTKKMQEINIAMEDIRRTGWYQKLAHILLDKLAASGTSFTNFVSKGAKATQLPLQTMKATSKQLSKPKPAVTSAKASNDFARLNVGK